MKTLQKTLLAASLASMGFTAYAQNLPVGGAIAADTGSISTAGNVMTVNQSSAKMVANWQSFNIGAGNKVVFNQVNNNAIALNRVGGTTASAINGQLQANGTVILLNPNGVMFGSTAQVNMGGLVASTHGTDSNSVFMDRNNFTMTTAGNGTVSNAGSINATGGSATPANIVLAARTVSNSGTLTNTKGRITLQAAQTTGIDLSSQSDVRLSSDKALTSALSVVNTGTIQTTGGSVGIAAGHRSGGRANSFGATIVNSGSVTLNNVTTGDAPALIIYSTGNAGTNSSIVQTGSITATATNSAQAARISIWAFSGKLDTTGAVFGGTAKINLALEGDASSTMRNLQVNTNGGYLVLGDGASNLSDSNLNTQGGQLSSTGEIRFSGNNTINIGGGTARFESFKRLTFSADSVLSLNGAGTYVFTGSSTANTPPAAISMERNASVTNTGAAVVDFVGTGKGASSIGVLMAGGAKVNNLGTGTLTIKGSTNGAAGSYGVKMETGSVLKNASTGRVRILGAATLGTGVALQGASLQNTDGGGFYALGTATAGVGLDLSGTTLTNTKPGDVVLSGTSAQTNFGVVLRDGTVLNNAGNGRFSLVSISNRAVSSLSTSANTSVSSSIVKTDIHR